MKKLTIIVLGFLLTTRFLMAVEIEQENPFKSILGIKWGTNTKDFLSTVKYKVHQTQGGFITKDIQLSDITLPTVYFNFKSTIDNLKWKEKNYPKYILDTVWIDVELYDFDNMKSILTSKYGSPKYEKTYSDIIDTTSKGQITGGLFEKILSTSQNNKIAVQQTEVRWENEDRRITFYRHSEETLGAVLFEPINTESEKEASDLL